LFLKKLGGGANAGEGDKKIYIEERRKGWDVKRLFSPGLAPRD